jgi:hypothetical protein
MIPIGAKSITDFCDLHAGPVSSKEHNKNSLLNLHFSSQIEPEILHNILTDLELGGKIEHWVQLQQNNPLQV